MPGIISEWFFKYEFPAYYDIETGTANFDSPEFISYLKRTKNEIPKLEEMADWDMTVLLLEWMTLCRRTICSATMISPP